MNVRFTSENSVIVEGRVGSQSCLRGKKVAKEKKKILSWQKNWQVKEKLDESTKSRTVRGLKRRHKIREDVAKEWLVEVGDKQPQMEEHDRKQSIEDEVWKEIEDYSVSWQTEKKRSLTKDTKTWQLTQSSENKH